MDGFPSGDVVAQVRHVLDDKDYARDLTEYNYGVARRFFSYNRVQNEWQAIFNKPGLAPPCGGEPR